MKDNQHSFVHDLSIEALNHLLSENPKETEHLYGALKKENEQKRDSFLSELKTRISASETKHSTLPSNTAD